MRDAIILSDVHLGSDNCQAKELSNFLETIETKKLILNGDIFDSIDFRRLKKHHWHVLSKIRKLSDHIETVWCQGNHDGPADIVSHLIGCNVVPEYIFESGGKKVLVLHGDRFDNFTTNHPVATYFADWIYCLLQKLDKNHYWARLAKHSSKSWARCEQQVRELSVKYAAELKCDFVCVGHTHHAVEDGIYFNSGCWTEQPCSYLTVNDGKIEVCYLSVDKTSSIV